MNGSLVLCLVIVYIVGCVFGWYYVNSVGMFVLLVWFGAFCAVLAVAAW